MLQYIVLKIKCTTFIFKQLSFDFLSSSKKKKRNVYIQWASSLKRYVYKRHYSLTVFNKAQESRISE